MREIRTSGLTRGSNGIGKSRPLLSTLLVHLPVNVKVSSPAISASLRLWFEFYQTAAGTRP